MDGKLDIHVIKSNVSRLAGHPSKWVDNKKFWNFVILNETKIVTLIGIQAKFVVGVFIQTAKPPTPHLTNRKLHLTNRKTQFRTFAVRFAVCIFTKPHYAVRFQTVVQTAPHHIFLYFIFFNFIYNIYYIYRII